MKIKHRFLLIYLSSALVVSLFGYFSYQNSQKTHQEYEQLNQQSLPLLDALHQAKFAALRIVSATAEAGLLRHIQTEGDVDEASLAADEEQGLAEEGVQQLTEAVELYRGLVYRYFPDEIGFSIQIEQQAELLLQLSEQFFSALENSEGNNALLFIKEQLELAERRFLVVSQQAMDHETEEIEERTLEVSAAINKQLQILLVGVCLFVLLGVLMALHNAKYIIMPLYWLRDAANRIARGDLSVEVPVQTQDEMGELFLSFNQMTKSLKVSKDALDEAYGYTENILHAMEDILVTTNADGIILKTNRAACEQLGYSSDQLLGSPVALLLGSEINAITDLLPTNTAEHFERNLRNSQGHSVPVLASLNRIHGVATQQEGFLLIATNISARKLAEDKLHKLAFYDPLSGLPNRTLFHDRLQLAVKFAHRHNHHLAVLFLDIDNFKQVNDSLGHDVGDQLLREVSERLVLLLRDSDIVAQGVHKLMTPTVSRHGGDEFLILLPYIAEPFDAGKVAERIQQQFNQSIQLNTQEVFATLSIGISIFPDNGSDGRLLVQNADTALYNAKAKGKNLFSFFTAEMNTSALRRLDVENNLRHALRKQEFRLYYQPQLELDSGRVIGMEALIRWHHPEWGVVPPVEFIPIAESSRLIEPIGNWVLREACTQWRSWKDQGLNPGKMSVNLSALQFRNNTLFSTLKDIIQQSGIDPSSLVLEITETVLMKDADVTLSQLREIRELGVQFAVDDFGTGYSSLSYLKIFPLNYLKIDRAFVRDLESSESDQEIVHTIISMAKNLKLLLIAEGVETPGQLRILQAERCNYMQGFLLSRPVPAEEYQTNFLMPGCEDSERLVMCARDLN